MNENKFLELVSLEQATKVAAKDAASVSSTPQRYVSENSLAYHVLLNTWIISVKDFCRYGWMQLLDLINDKGLLAVIKRFDDAAQRIVHELPVVDPMVLSMQNDITRDGFPKGIAFTDGFTYGENVTTALLTLLRYPRRFSPRCADLIERSSLEKFMVTENRNKQKQRVEYPRFVIDEARAQIRNLLPWDKVISDINNLTDQDLTFTSGVGFDSTERLGSKLEAIGNSFPEFFVNPFGIPYSGAYPRQEVRYWGSCDDPYNEVKVHAVPKSYKAARIIAMEDTLRQSRARTIASLMMRYLPDCVDVTDQTRNQEYARIGSIDGSLATIDMSSASDTITKTLWRELFPRDFVSLIDPLLGTHCVYPNGSIRQMQMCATSGHSLTFIIETIVHWGIASAAVAKVRKYGFEVARNVVSFYGDDGIVPTEAFTCVTDFFTRVGMIVNVEKSFFEGYYRESCGEEYLKGVRTTSIYYPRFPIVGTYDKRKKPVLAANVYRDTYRGKVDDSTTMLIDLQKKLYGFSYLASRFVFNLVKLAYPRITYSRYGSICSDLWEYDDGGVSVTTRRYQVVKNKWERLPDFDLNRMEPSTEDSETHTKWEIARRETLHLSPQLSYRVEKEPGSYKQRLIDLYRYQYFLQHGPRYMNALDELLHISSPIAPDNQTFGVGKITWRLTYSDN